MVAAGLQPGKEGERSVSCLQWLKSKQFIPKISFHKYDISILPKSIFWFFKISLKFRLWTEIFTFENCQTSCWFRFECVYKVEQKFQFLTFKIWLHLTIILGLLKFGFETLHFWNVFSNYSQIFHLQIASDATLLTLMILHHMNFNTLWNFELLA